jgi:hypothetical protein
VCDGDGEVVVGPVRDGGGTEMPESEAEMPKELLEMIDDIPEPIDTELAGAVVNGSGPAGAAVATFEVSGERAGTVSVGVMLMDGTEVVDDTSLPGVTVVSEVVVATVVRRVTVVVKETQSEPWTVTVVGTVTVVVTGKRGSSASKFVSCFALSLSD